MYKQTIAPKKTRPLIALLLIVIIVAVICATYAVFSIWDTGVDAKRATAGVLLIALLIGYFIFKPSGSSFVYTVEDKTVTLQQFTQKRIIKEATFSLDDISAVEAGKGGIRFYPSAKHQLLTISVNGEKYTVAPDSVFGAIINKTPYTDVAIDRDYNEMCDTLSKLIAYPSVKDAPAEGMPFGTACADALRYTLELCEGFGMRTKNLENYCGWAEIGEGEKLIAILCHLDVVPAGDGWDSDPFTARFTDTEVFGRGTIDDKGPAVAAIYAVKALLEAHRTLPCRVRLIFGCDEESGWGCMDRYSATEDIPDMAFTPDADYPVIITEKGIAHVQIDSSLNEGEYQLYLGGGLRANMVPDKAQATVIGNIDKLFNVLNEYDAHSKGITFTATKDTLKIEASGIGAHGSTPEKGVNAFFELFKLLKALDLKGSQGEFVDSMINAFVDKTDGSGVALDLCDDISGHLTLNLGICHIGKNEAYPEMNDDSTRTVIDIRYPVSYDIKDISARLQSALPDSWECEILHGQAPHHVDASSPLVTTLLSVYREYTGRDDEPIAIGGGTYARTLPGKAVAFGVAFPERPDKAHQPNESMNLYDFKISAKMFASAIEKLVFNK